MRKIKLEKRIKKPLINRTPKLRTALCSEVCTLYLVENLMKVVCLVSTQYKFVGKLYQPLMSMSFSEIWLLGLLQGSM